MANFSEIRKHAGLKETEAWINVETLEKVFETPDAERRYHQAAMALMENNRD